MQKIHTSFSTESHVVVSKISTTSLISCFRNIKSSFPKCYCDDMIKDEIKCFLVFPPEILVVNSHIALLEKVITADTFSENLMKSKYKEVKKYSAITALCEKRLFCLKETVVSSSKKMVMSLLQKTR